MTKRLVTWVFALLMAGCLNPGDKTEILPMTLGEWKRVSVENIPPEEHPQELKQRGIQRARRATYQSAAGRVTAAIYEFGAGAVAFEMVQKWRPEPGKIAFHQGPYFAVLAAGPDDNKAMNAFAGVLEAWLKK